MSEKNKYIRILNTDGVGAHTKVLDQDGNEIQQHICSIALSITADDVVKAVVEMFPQVDVVVLDGQIEKLCPVCKQPIPDDDEEDEPTDSFDKKAGLLNDKPPVAKLEDISDG